MQHPVSASRGTAHRTPQGPVPHRVALRVAGYEHVPLSLLQHGRQPRPDAALDIGAAWFELADIPLAEELQRLSVLVICRVRYDAAKRVSCRGPAPPA